VQVADPLGGAVRFQYDPNSNLTKVIDPATEPAGKPRGGEVTYDYDPMDQLVTRTDPLGRQEIFGYDIGGNLNSFRDRKNQLTTWSAYDNLNRPTTVTFQGGATLTYGYDAANRLETLTDSIAGPITWVYDPLDRMTRETTPQGTVDYGLDDADRRTSMLVAGQPQVSYTWDSANRLTDITRGSLAAHYVYDNANRRTQLRLPNLVTIDYGYDAANRLTSLTYSGLAGGNQNLTYAYDAASNRTLMSGSWARTLLPAAITTASYDAANRQLTLGGKTMTYDFNGNLETLTDGGQATTYTWNARNLLTGISGLGLSASFTYDALRRRTQKTISGFTTTFQHDRWDIVREVAGGSNVNYLRSLGMDETFARITDSDTTCYLPDALDSTLALADMNGNTTTSYSYGPFGHTAPTGPSSANAFQYTGRENDGTGDYYYRSRYYSPLRARFLSEDPIGLAGGDSNLYRYVFNNPINLLDPSGLAAVCCRPAFWGFVVSPRAGEKAQHCFIRDDDGSTHSFFRGPKGYMRYSRDDPGEAPYRDTSNCKECERRKCQSPAMQQMCIEAWGYSIPPYSWLPGRGLTSNTGLYEIASRCCSGGFPSGLGWAPGAEPLPGGWAR
jgi:RHS repeat-associated protein